MVSLLPTPEPPDPVEGALGHFDHTNWVKASLKALDAGCARVANAVFSTTVVIDNAASEVADLVLKGNLARSLWGYNALGKARWRVILGDNAAEDGAEGGANFLVLGYTDDGSTAKTVLSGVRKTGLLTVFGSPTTGKGIATKEYVDAAVPVGTVIMWASSTLPADGNWVLCDGRSTASYPLLAPIVGSTVPDLRSRFVVGAGQGTGLTNYALKAAGGAESVALTEAQVPLKAHTHTIDHDHTVFDSGAGTSHSHTINHDHGQINTGDDTHQHTLSIREGTGTGDGYYLDTNPTDSGTQKTLAASSTSQDTHSHTVNLPLFTGSSGPESLHTHPVNVPAFAGTSGPASATAAATAHENRPPYFALSYIIKWR